MLRWKSTAEAVWPEPWLALSSHSPNSTIFFSLCLFLCLILSSLLRHPLQHLPALFWEKKRRWIVLPFQEGREEKSLNLKLPKNTGEKGGGDVRRERGGGEGEGLEFW